MTGPRVVLAGVLLIGLAMLPPTPADAGQVTCEPNVMQVGEMEAAVQSAVNLKRELEKGRTKAAIIARVGSDVRKQGLKYTHVAFVRWNTSLRQWIVTHQLNDCGSGNSRLVNHGLLEFMIDDPFSWDILVIHVKPSLQRAIVDTLKSGDPKIIHDPRYSMISYPRGEPRYQNSNQWLLEALTQAQARLEGARLFSRAQTHAYYQRRGFRGSIIRISGFKRAFSGSIPHIKFDDHPDGGAASGRYEIVSVKSVVNYLRRQNLVTRTTELRL